VVPDALIASLLGFAKLPIPGGIFAVDGTVLAMNEAAERLINRTPAQTLGRKAWDIAPGAEYIWEDVLAQARRQGSFRGEISIATPQEPRTIYYVLTLREYQGASYVVLFALQVPDERSARITDVETQHRLEALGLVAGSIANDFNNQLVSVLAEASVAREHPELGEASREALHRIEAAAHRMAQLTRQLLAYAGRGRFVTELIDPDDLLLKTRETLTRSVRPDAELRIEASPGRVAVEADRGLLAQVIQNLVVNASEALGDAGGAITIETKLDDKSWLLEVSDTGTGMDAHTTARIFDPFFTTKRDRHGLGLSAVHGIVRRLGGAVTVESRLGSGTRFRVRLPAVVGAVPQRKRSPTQESPLAKLEAIRILIADDEPSVLATLRRLLERRGAQVVVAADGAQARARLAEGEYHVVLFDVMMPELTGYQLLPVVRELQPKAKVLLMSGYSEQARGSGGDEPDAFLDKPFAAKALDLAIDQLLATR
jgi:signal transduction histidine kinase/CheY-like chemotaxis protein